MKNILLASSFIFGLISCNKTESKSENLNSEVVRDTIQQVSPKIENSEQGLSLIQSYDCLSCHNKDQKMVGPSYKEIALKYKVTDANIDMLADKIINGGAGNWGQIPMPAHIGLNKIDAKGMVKYILSQK